MLTTVKSPRWRKNSCKSQVSSDGTLSVVHSVGCRTPPGQPSGGRGFVMTVYDPFVPGPFPVGVRTIQAFDQTRDRNFPCEIWSPIEEHPGTYPLIVFSHSSGGGRRQSTFLCNHLSSHGYVVAALDHSEAVAPELARKDKDNETAGQKAARQQAWIANRVPDIRFLLDRMLQEANVDPARIGIVGHSFGGWTALAAPDVEERIRAVVALAPGGSSQPKPGILKADLHFNWRRDVPTLYLVAENDVAGLREALRGVLVNPQLREELGACAAERAFAQLSAQRQRDMMHDVLSTILGNPIK